eukprot:2071924-Alexandrium_andersonii.AAC.1
MAKTLLAACRFMQNPMTRFHLVLFLALFDCFDHFLRTLFKAGKARSGSAGSSSDGGPTVEARTILDVVHAAAQVQVHLGAVLSRGSLAVELLS